MMSTDAVRASLDWVKFYQPTYFGQEIWEFFRTDQTLFWSFLGVVVPMGLINAVGSLQNIESAEAAGDRFSTGPCMAVNGIGSIAAGLFGSCFPTTIYIGHPGWKALGARCGYSILNAVFFTVIFLLGLGSLIVAVIPMEAGIAIVLWIGVIIAAQAYEAVPKRHYPAVALGFFPAVAMMAVLLVPNILGGAGATDGIYPMIAKHNAALEGAAATDQWWPVGVYALAGANSGFVLTGIIIAAVSAFLIDRRFRTAGIWLIIAAVVTLAGFQHAYRVEPGAHSVTPKELLVWQRAEARFEGSSLHLTVPEDTFMHRGYRIAAGYLAAALLCLVIHRARSKNAGFENIDMDEFGTVTASGEGDAAPPRPVRKPPKTPKPAKEPTAPKPGMVDMSRLRDDSAPEDSSPPLPQTWGPARRSDPPASDAPPPSGDPDSGSAPKVSGQ
jgi:AGZA family xanthine/uracil permease-like MFS transporter